MNVRRMLLAGWLIGLLPSAAWSQGLLVVESTTVAARLPRPIPTPVPPEQSYRIKELSIQTRLADQVAQVEVGQTFVNTGSQPLEVSFVFPLPYDGAIDRLTMMVDGREVAAKLLSAEEARKHFEEIVSKNRDPALLEWMGSGLFKTSVFPVPPGGERKVSLRYVQLCRQDRQLTDFLFPLSTARYTSQPLEKLSIELALETRSNLKNIYSPTHSVEVKRSDDHHATVSYKAENIVPSEDFRLFFDVDTAQVGATVLSYRPKKDDDGFFLLLSSPEIKKADETRAAKTVMMICDRSGSMSGAKIEQAKGALKFVLNNLHEGDLFNIVTYESQVTSFRPELMVWNDDNRKAALGFVEGIFAGGGTNIDAALAAGLEQLKDPARPSYVLFLTDGLPTEGETGESQIVARSREHNQVHARMFSFGVGYDVNSRLLDRLVRENFGQSQYVRPNEDIESHVSRLYQRIESPVMTGIEVGWTKTDARPEDPAVVNRQYPPGVFDLFQGEQVVLVGRYRQSGAATVTLEGKVGGQEVVFAHEVTLADETTDATYAFIEKLWAVRRVGEIIDQLDLKGQNPELVKELVELATRHGIITPYTSFLADETTDLNAVTSNAVTAGVQLRGLAESSGSSGFAQRAAKAQLQFGGGGFGGGPAQTSVPAAAGVVTFQDASDREVRVAGVYHQGNKSFFRRNAVLVDSTVTPAQEKAAIRIEQFSREYFELAATNGRVMSQYLVFDEPVLVNLGNQTYRIEPPAPLVR